MYVIFSIKIFHKHFDSCNMHTFCINSIGCHQSCGKLNTLVKYVEGNGTQKLKKEQKLRNVDVCKFSAGNKQECSL